MGAADNLRPEQLSMFMTARDIQSRYQVLDADREETQHDRYYEPTNRPISTAGNANMPIPTAVRNYRRGKDYVDELPAGWDWAAKRHGSALGNYTHLHGDDYASETDTQVWDRKLSETHMAAADYREMHMGEDATPAGPDYEGMAERLPAPVEPQHRGAGTSTWNDYHDAVASWEGHVESGAEREFADKHDDRSLYEKIATTEGGVTHPVHLGTGGETGSQDKPMVYGGHHRIAAMAHLNPDQLIPVLHYSNFWDARDSPDYT